MDASLDTDDVIHLYGSGKEDLVYDFFNQTYMHEYLFDKELNRKAPMVCTLLKADVANGRVRIISNNDLYGMGILGLYEGYIREYKHLFDHGELCAIAMAKAIGIDALVSNDTKEFGPHESLVKELIEDVMPFAFYELLFLRYLSSLLTLEEMQHEFAEVVSKTMRRFPMNYKSKMLNTVRRFSRRHGRSRDYKWLMEYCDEHKVDLDYKMVELKKQLIG
jgi:hypothetical protein